MFQFLDQLRKPYRGRRIGCCSRQSPALLELPFELFSVALLIHDGTPLFYETAELLDYRDRLPSKYIPEARPGSRVPY
jgi:hypothetical protein